MQILRWGQRQTLAINNTDEIQIPEAVRKFVNEFKVKSFMSAPDFYGEIPIGRLVIHYTKEYQHFTQVRLKVGNNY